MDSHEWQLGIFFDNQADSIDVLPDIFDNKTNVL